MDISTGNNCNIFSILGQAECEILYYENFDLVNLITPINAEAFQQLLTESKYDEEKTKFVIDGFKNGFDLGYRAKYNAKVKITSPNLKIRVGDEINL